MSNDFDVNVGGFFKNGIKSVEKLALYVIGILESTGAINLGKVSHTVGTLSIAGIISAIHLSTTKAPKA